MTVSENRLSGSERMKAARAARKPRDPSLPPLTDEQSLCLQAVRNAARSCKILAKAINAGKDVSPDAIEACATLTAMAARSLVRRGV